MLLSVFECRGRFGARKAVLSLLHLLVFPEALPGFKIKKSFEKSICDVTQYVYTFIEMCDVIN